MDILAKNIAQFNEVLASQIPAETLQAFQRSVQDLEEKQTGSKSLKIGERFPDFQLSNFDGHMYSLKDLLKNKKIIIVAHGNSLRGLIKYLDKISDEEIMNLEIETGNPICYELDETFNPIKHYYLK